MGGGERYARRSCARHPYGGAACAARRRQEGGGGASRAAEGIAGWRDGAGGSGEFFDRAGQGAGVVTGRLWQSGEQNQRRHAADATLDAARAHGGISAGVASKWHGVGGVGFDKNLSFF